MLFTLDSDLLHNLLGWVELRGLISLRGTHPNFKPLLTDSPSNELSLLGKAAGRPKNAAWIFMALCKIPQNSVYAASVHFWSKHLLSTPPSARIGSLYVRLEDCADPLGILSPEDDEPMDDDLASAIMVACSHGHQSLVDWAIKADFSAISGELARLDCAWDIGDGLVLAHINGHEDLVQLLRRYIIGGRNPVPGVELEENFLPAACGAAVHAVITNSTKCPNALKDILSDPGIFAAAGGLEIVWGRLLRAADPAALEWFLGHRAVPGELAIGDGLGLRDLLEREHYEAAAVLCSRYEAHVMGLQWTQQGDRNLLDLWASSGSAPAFVVSLTWGAPAL